MPKCQAQLDQEYYEFILKKDLRTITNEDVKFICSLIEGKTYAAGCNYLIQASALVGKRYLAKYGKKATEKHSNQNEATILQNIENQKLSFSSEIIKDIQDPRAKYFAILGKLLFTQGWLVQSGRTGNLYTAIDKITNKALYLYLPVQARIAYQYAKETISELFKDVCNDSSLFPDMPAAEKLDQLIKTRDKVFQDIYDKLGEGAVRKVVPDILKGFGIMQKLMQETDVTSNHLKELRDTLSQINNENNKEVVDDTYSMVRNILVSIEANPNRPLEMSQLYLDLCREFIPTEEEINKQKDPAVRAPLEKIRLKLLDTITVLVKTVSPSEINKEKGMELI